MAATTVSRSHRRPCRLPGHGYLRAPLSPRLVRGILWPAGPFSTWRWPGQRRREERECPHLGSRGSLFVRSLPRAGGRTRTRVDSPRTVTDAGLVSLGLRHGVHRAGPRDRAHARPSLTTRRGPVRIRTRRIGRLLPLDGPRGLIDRTGPDRARGRATALSRCGLHRLPCTLRGLRDPRAEAVGVRGAVQLRFRALALPRPR